MKFTLSWLKDYLETDASLEEITQSLTSIGLEVEDVVDPAAKFAAFSVAYVEKAESHPDADRLKVCDVQTKDGKVQVVCGAPNARTGMKAVFAPSGSYIPGLDVTLKKTKIRGVESNGMLVSEKEMQLSDEHKGIIDVTDHAAAEIGTPMADIFGLNDPVIEIGLTPNRADCAGIYGIARDLAVAGLGTLKPLPPHAIKGAFPSPVSVSLADDGQSCAAFYGRLIRGVKNGPSPQWLQNRLKAIGLRPISALVDITNFFTFAYARPLHVYDADKLQGDIHVRCGRSGESFAALNDKSYEVDDSMTCICDERGVLGLGGIVGGTSTGCEDDTVNVFLECAYFDPADIAKTGRKLQIVSDARYRFERGVDPEMLPQATEMATQMILDICGGEASEIVVAGKAPALEKSVLFDPQMTASLGGIEIPQERQKEILQDLGFTVDVQGDAWQVAVPSWRADIEGAADLVEEILRIHGLDHIMPVSVHHVSGAENNVIGQSDQPVSYLRRSAAQRSLASRGLLEAVSWSFVSDELAALFMPQDRPIDQAALTLVNPISNDLKRMRTSILSTLVPALKRNQDLGVSNASQGGAALFEVGPVFFGINPEDTLDMAAGVRHLNTGPKHWSGDGASRVVDAFDAKSDALEVIRACGGPASAQIEQGGAPSWYHPGRSGTIRLGKNVLGYFGEIHPQVLEEIDVLGPIAAFEVFLGAIPAPKGVQKTAKKLLEISPFQPVTRDFAFLLAEDVSAENLTRTMSGADKTLISDIDIFDIYQGKGVEDGQKSVAVRVHIQPQQATLTDKELEDLSGKIVGAVEKKLGGKLRG